MSEYLFDLSECQPFEVFWRKEHLGAADWPVDTDFRIVEAEGCLALRSIDVVDFILELGCVAQHEKSVCEPARNKQLTGVFIAQLNRHMAAECFGTGTEVNGYIEHSAARHAHKFGLCPFTFLEVKPAEHSARRHGFVVLHKFRVKTGGFLNSASLNDSMK